MKLPWLLLVGALVLVSLALAAVEFSCVDDSMCILLKGDGSSCVSGVCSTEAQEVDYTPIEKFLAPEESETWQATLPSREVSIDDLCSEVGCITLAPAKDSRYVNRFFFAWGR